MSSTGQTQRLNPLVALVALVNLLGGCHQSPRSLQPDAAASLGRLGRAPMTAGALVYRGTVYRQGRAAAAPVFEYERRVRTARDASVSTHLTRAPGDDTVMLTHTATHTRDYALRRFDVVDDQTGTVGTVRVLDDGRVALEVTDRRGHRSRIERPGPPVVVGPTLFGFALANWEGLVEGKTLKVRFPVVQRARTFGFALRLAHADANTTVFEFAATSALVRASVPSMRLVFDTASRRIVRYEGRVPPMLEHRGILRPFEARVEYTFVAPRYS